MSNHCHYNNNIKCDCPTYCKELDKQGIEDEYTGTFNTDFNRAAEIVRVRTFDSELSFDEYE